MSNRDNDLNAFLSGFFLGGLVGVAVALLYAPQSGEQTRSFIKEKSIEIKDKTLETAEEARLHAEKSLEEARIKAEHALEEARIKADELTQITKQRAIELQQRGQVVIEEQKTKIEGVIEAGKKAAKRDSSKSGSEQTPV